MDVGGYRTRLQDVYPPILPREGPERLRFSSRQTLPTKHSINTLYVIIPFFFFLRYLAEILGDENGILGTQRRDRRVLCPTLHEGPGPGKERKKDSSTSPCASSTPLAYTPLTRIHLYK